MNFLKLLKNPLVFHCVLLAVSIRTLSLLWKSNLCRIVSYENITRGQLRELSTFSVTSKKEKEESAHRLETHTLAKTQDIGPLGPVQLDFAGCRLKAGQHHFRGAGLWHSQKANGRPPKQKRACRRIGHWDICDGLLSIWALRLSMVTMR